MSAAKAYLRRVKRLIPCAHALRADFLSRFEDEVWLYCEDCAVESEEQLTRRFGSPDQIAEEFLTTLSPSVLQRSLRRERLLMRCIAALCAAVLLMMAIASVMLHRRWERYVSRNAVSLVQDAQGAEMPAYWVKTNDGQNVLYWEYDYVKDEWVNVPVGE